MALRILITNDDGIESPGLKILVDVAKEYGEVTVVAPKFEQSAKSHALTLKKAVEFKKSNIIEGVLCYTLDSTPADCVRFGHYGLLKDYDLVLSGINIGFNVGEDIMYSGTVAAIFEAKSIKSKGISFSTGVKGFDGIKEKVKESLDYIINNNLFDYCDIYNVNIPYDSKGFRITRVGGCNFDTFFSNKEDDMYLQEGFFILEESKDLMHLDTACVSNKMISITPLTIDRTDLKAYNEIKRFNNI